MEPKGIIYLHSGNIWFYSQLEDRCGFPHSPKIDQKH